MLYALDDYFNVQHIVEVPVFSKVDNELQLLNDTSHTLQFCLTGFRSQTAQTLDKSL